MDGQIKPYDSFYRKILVRSYKILTFVTEYTFPESYLEILGLRCESFYSPLQFETCDVFLFCGGMNVKKQHFVANFLKKRQKPYWIIVVGEETLKGGVWGLNEMMKNFLFKEFNVDFFIDHLSEENLKKVIDKLEKEMIEGTQV